jgi:hypothetical protein
MSGRPTTYELQAEEDGVVGKHSMKRHLSRSSEGIPRPLRQRKSKSAELVQAGVLCQLPAIVINLERRPDRISHRMR